MVGLNLALNLALIWTPLAEAGLAVATSVSAVVQVIVLALIFSRGKSPLGWSVLAATAARTAGATLLMAAAAFGALIMARHIEGFTGDLARVLLPLAAGVAVYAAGYRLLGGRELGLLLHGDLR